jgi:hypothetical protein
MRLIATSIMLALLAGAGERRLDLLHRRRAGRSRGLDQRGVRRVARARLEADFASYLRGRGVAGADAQCPRPKDDKTAAVNAQFTAVEFNRKLGRALREVAASDFPLRR